MCSCGLGHMLAFKPRPKTKENYCERATEQSGKKKSEAGCRSSSVMMIQASHSTVRIVNPSLNFPCC